MNSEQESINVRIARNIASNGLVFQEDGADLLTLLDNFSRSIRAYVPHDILEVYLAERLTEFQAAFGWRHPWQSDEVTESVMGMLAKLYVRGLNLRK